MMRATIPTARALTAAHLRCPDLRVDPRTLLYESDEDNNSSRRPVHLPFHGDTGC
jgi:hypothetical protein